MVELVALPWTLTDLTNPACPYWARFKAFAERCTMMMRGSMRGMTMILQCV